MEVPIRGDLVEALLPALEGGLADLGVGSAVVLVVGPGGEGLVEGVEGLDRGGARELGEEGGADEAI